MYKSPRKKKWEEMTKKRYAVAPRHAKHRTNRPRKEHLPCCRDYHGLANEHEANQY